MELFKNRENDRGLASLAALQARQTVAQQFTANMFSGDRTDLAQQFTAATFSDTSHIKLAHYFRALFTG